MLALLSSQPGEALAALPLLDPRQMADLDVMVDQHRLAPLLHHLHGDDGTLPDTLARAWKSAFRLSAVEALAHRAERDALLALLNDAGLHPVVLKGGWLAWHVYPHAACRPLRDLDLLLPPQEVVRAQSLLQTHGYVAGPAELPLEAMLKLDKHLPPLSSPQGIRVELHHRLWEVDGRMDHAAPDDNAAVLVARARRDGALRYLAPADCLMHLIVHAVYDHRLDCGPLLLSDIRYLLDRHEIDWPQFWRSARDGGWEKGARLVLDLAERQHQLAIAFPDDQPPTPGSVLNAAPDLLLQDLHTRQSAGVVATARMRGMGGLLRRLSARRHDPETDAGRRRDLSAEGGFAGWARGRLARTVTQLSRADVRQQSANLAELSKWLGSH